MFNRKRKLSHVVIIRMHYPENDPRFEFRFDFFKAMVLPRLLNQTVGDFDIAIWCNKWHEDRIKALSDRIITFSIRKSAEGYIRPEDRERAKEYGGSYFIDFTKWSNVIGLDMYDIQTGLDTDDLILRDDYIEKIEELCNKTRRSLHLSFQPYMFDVNTLRTYSCPFRYSPTKGSPFLSLFQPRKYYYKFLYHDSHLKMGRYGSKSVVIPEGYCAFSIHGNNESSRIPPKSKRILL